MSRYILIRLLLIIPTLLVISLIAFLLSKSVPQDPVESKLTLSGFEDSNQADVQAYSRLYNKMGLDKPNFYVSIKPNYYPPNINLVSDYSTKNLIRKLLDLGMEGTEAIAFASSESNNEYKQLSLARLKAEITASHKLNTFYYPKVFWHGANNQYHHWLSSLLKGDFGESLANGKAAFSVVKKALVWTLHVAIPSLLFAFSIGILLGYYISVNPQGKKEKLINQILYGLYAIPVFWLATMAVMYLTTDDYGSWTNLFPSVGIDIYPELSTSGQIRKNITKLILPVIIGSIGTIAYLARILRRSILDEMTAPYIMTAYSKGLSHKNVLKKHALPNALLPIVTIFAGAIPLTLSGSLVLEVIFNIPGVGRLMMDSIRIADWNIVFCIIMITGLITILSYILADILYAYFNPKIRFS